MLRVAGGWSISQHAVCELRTHHRCIRAGAYWHLLHRLRFTAFNRATPPPHSTWITLSEVTICHRYTNVKVSVAASSLVIRVSEGRARHFLLCGIVGMGVAGLSRIYSIKKSVFPLFVSVCHCSQLSSWRHLDCQRSFWYCLHVRLSH